MNPLERVRALIARLDQARDEALQLAAALQPVEPPAPEPAPAPAPDPAPAPEPAPAPDPAPAPAAPATGDLWTHVTHDDGTGPSWEHWSKQANILWSRPGGDWIDAAGVMHGAAPDGVLQTWLDGVLIDSRTDMRWRRHPEMGVGSPWVNWFFGGKQAANSEQHWRMGRCVLARAYIGPARA